MKTLPVCELIADAIPKIQGFPLKVGGQWVVKSEIFILCQAISLGLQNILLISSKKLLDALTAIETKAKADGDDIV